MTRISSGLRRGLRHLVLLVGSMLLAFGVSRAQAQSAPPPFYQGKTITILVGFPPGGSYDVYSRLAIQFMPRYIPGHPNIIMQYKPGGSGVVAMLWFATQAPTDGTALLLAADTFVATQLIEPEIAKWDARNFRYIGSFSNATYVFMLRRDAEAKTIHDMQEKKVIAGCNGPTGGTYLYPLLMNSYAGMKFDIVCGYPGTPDLHTALDRGEVDMVAISWNLWKSLADVKSGLLHPVIQVGLKRLADLPDVPLMQDIIPDPKNKKVAEFFSGGSSIGRGLITPASVPAERINELRQAFDQMVKDPEFKAAVAKADIGIDPTPGAEVDKMVMQVLDTPPDVVKQALTLMKPK